MEYTQSILRHRTRARARRKPLALARGAIVTLVRRLAGRLPNDRTDYIDFNSCSFD
jgi:hypothetical protein